MESLEFEIWCRMLNALRIMETVHKLYDKVDILMNLLTFPKEATA